MRNFTDKFGNLSLKNKIIIIVVTIMLVSTSMLGVVFNRHVSGIIIDNTLVQSEQTLRQTADYLDYRLKNILMQFNILEINKELTSIVSKEQPTIEDRRKVAGIFEENRSQNQDFVDSIFMCGKYGEMFYENIKVLSSNFDAMETEWYKAAVNNRRKLVWQGIVEDEVFRNNSGIKKFRIVKAVENTYGEFCGVLVFEFKEPVLQQLLRNVDFDDSGRVYILDEYGGIVSSVNAQEKDNALLSEISDSKNGSSVVTDMLVSSYNTLDINGWKIVHAISTESLTAQIRSIRIFTMYCILLCFVLVVVLARIMAAWITRPIKKFDSMIKQFEKGDFSVRFNSEHGDEIGRLGDTFDDMCENITDLMNRLTEEKVLKQQAEIKILQEQIKSHFLYNTLDSIYWMSKSGDNEKTANMIASLAKMFRLSLNGGKDITSVSNEVEHVNAYIYIEKIRKGEKYSFEVCVEEAIMSYRVPKIILQPLVENAIIHGMQHKKQGCVQVRGYEKDGFMFFEVRDDAGLMNVSEIKENLESKKTANSEAHGYALLNLKNRLSTIYHRDDVIEFECEPEKYSCVTIKLPCSIK